MGYPSVIVGQRKCLARFFDEAPKLECFAKIQRHRLVAGNVEPGLLRKLFATGKCK